MTPFLASKRVALIGGAGFIGHNLALRLHELGAKVEVVDSLQVNNLGWFASNKELIDHRDLYLCMIHERLDLLRARKIPLHVQDARDYHALSRLLNEMEPEVIVVLAAVAHAGRSNKDPFSTFDHSLRTLENALDCARGKVDQFIFLSSSMVYGNFMTPEVVEDHPLNPIGIYGAIKLAGEKIVIAYQQVFDLPYTIIRPSALYGPRCVSRRVGQVFIENAFQGRELRLSGDGNEKLDFTYIDDLTNGIALAIGNPMAHNQVFNLTYGSSRSILDLLELVREQFPDATVEHIERDQHMPFRGTLNVDRARELLGYSPTVPIDDGIPTYIDWYRELFASEDAGPLGTVGAAVPR